MRRHCLAFLLVLLLPAGASAAPYRIHVSDFGTVTKIGPFKPKRNSRLGAAIRAFGEPDSRRLTQYQSCVVRWHDLDLVIEFANYGGVPEGETICSGKWGLAQNFLARGRRFASWRGLRPGMRSRAVPRRHPDATRHARSWWLETYQYPFGEGGPSPVVKAIVRHARVTAIAGYIGGAGE